MIAEGFLRAENFNFVSPLPSLRVKSWHAPVSRFGSSEVNKNSRGKKEDFFCTLLLLFTEQFKDASSLANNCPNIEMTDVPQPKKIPPKKLEILRLIPIPDNFLT